MAFDPEAPLRSDFVAAEAVDGLLCCTATSSKRPEFGEIIPRSPCTGAESAEREVCILGAVGAFKLEESLSLLLNARRHPGDFRAVEL